MQKNNQEMNSRDSSQSSIDSARATLSANSLSAGDRLPSVSEGVDDDFVMCKLCMNRLDMPKLLPCLHSFCLLCLSRHVAETIGDNGTFTCPECSTEISMPADGVSAFKTNFFLAHLAEVLSSTNVTPENCGVCKMQGRHRLSLYKCIECGDYLCEQCARAHNYTRYTMGHQVMSIDDLRSGKFESQIRAKQKLHCSRHQNRELQLFCIDCHDMICESCASGFHRLHNCSTPEQASVQWNKLLTSQLEKLRQKIREQDYHMNNIDSKREVLQRNKGEVEQKIRQCSATLQELIQYSERQLLSELNDLSLEQTKQFNDSKALAELKLDNMLECYHFTKRLLKHGKDHEIVALAGVVHHHMEQLGLISLVYPPSQTQINFVPDSDVEDFMRTRTPLLGSIDKVQLGFSKLLLQFSCRSSTDKADPLPTGVCVNTKNEIVIADYSNKKLKTFDANGKLKAEYVCDHLPWNVLTTKAGRTIFTEDSLISRCQLSLLDVDKKVLMTKVVPRCKALALTPDEQYILVATTEEDAASILIFQPDGKLMGKIDTKLDDKIKFRHPWYIATKKNGDLIVSDKLTKMLYIIAPNGDLIYTHNTLVHGICVDRRDNIIIADGQNNLVLLLSSSGKLLRQLLSVREGVRGVQALTLNNEADLIVTEESGMVKIFRY